MGECLPRRVPPDARKRLATITTKMAPGNGNGATRAVQPIPKVPPWTTSPSPGPGVGGRVQFWYDHWPFDRGSGQPEVHHLTWLPLLYSEHVYLDGVEQQESIAWRRVEQDIIVLPAMQRHAGQLLEVRYAYDGRQPGGEPLTLPPIEQGQIQLSFNTHSVWRIMGSPAYGVSGNQGAFDCAFDHANHGGHNTAEFWSPISHSCSTVVPGDGFDEELHDTVWIGDSAYTSPTLDLVPMVEVYVYQAQFTPRAFMYGYDDDKWFDETGTPIPTGGDILWETAPFSNDFRYRLGVPYDNHQAASLVSGVLTIIGLSTDLTPDEEVTAGVFMVGADDVGSVFGPGSWAQPENIGPADRLGTVTASTTPGVGTFPGPVNLDIDQFVYDPPDQPYPQLLFMTDNSISETPQAALTGGALDGTSHERRMSFVYRVDYIIQPPRYKVVVSP